MFSRVMVMQFALVEVLAVGAFAFVLAFASDGCGQAPLRGQQP